MTAHLIQIFVVVGGIGNLKGVESIVVILIYDILTVIVNPLISLLNVELFDGS